MNNNYLPYTTPLPVSKLAGCFNNTSASYKYFWLIAILEIVNQENKQKILFSEIFAKMVCKAWYAVNFYKLSFGAQDKLETIIRQILELANGEITIDVELNKLYNFLIDKPGAVKIMKHLEANVPFWFLSPWFPKKSKSDIVKLSNDLQNDSLYSLHTSGEKSIEINENWFAYLKDNYRVIHDFCYWNLANFVQDRNPSIPNVVQKICNTAERPSLNSERKLWRAVFQNVTEIKCIYTGNSLTTHNYDLDHFLPWSFVAHNQLWNLIPADKSINSSKSNHIPVLEQFFDNFVDMQNTFVKTAYSLQPK